MSGYEDQTFRPENNVTRGEFCAVMVRMLGGSAYKEPEFNDVSKNHWAYESIGKALGMGLISGYGNGNFGPDDKVTYEQVFKILGAALGYENEAAAMGGYPNGWIEVAKRLSITEFEVADKSSPAIRGNIAKFIANALVAPQKNGKTIISSLDKDGLATKLYDTKEFTDEDYSARVFVVGDSTAAKYLPGQYPKTGWGDVFSTFLSEDVMTLNLAKEGESAASFAGDMETFLDKVKSGDYILISFGFDEARTNPVPTTGYKNSIKNIITKTREKGATPIIICPVNSDMDINEYQKELKIIALSTGASIVDLAGKAQISSGGSLTPEEAEHVATVVKESLEELKLPLSKFFK